MIKRLLFLFSFFLVLSVSKATVWTCTACPATWSGSPYPFWSGSTQCTSANLANGDIFVIPANCSVTISGVVTMAKDITLQLNGSLIFPTSGDKLNLTANSVIIAGPTGKLVGVSNSNQIKIGTGSAEWSGPGTLNGPFIITDGFLPIELIVFTGDFEQKVVYLQWKTATETNNDYYVLEKSADGVNFSDLATIKSLAPGGTSQSPLSYNYIDQDLKDPVYYYRLRQVDLNKDSKRTNSISVKIYTADFSIFPNPNNGTFNINVPSVQLHEELSVKIYDAMGNLVHESTEPVKNQNITGSSVEVVPPQILPKGVYTSIITFEGQSHILKLVVQ
jgi:hypothetical protein